MGIPSSSTALALFAGLALSGSASAQTARDIRGPSPYEQLANEPAPRLIVDPPLSETLKIGVFQAQYRVENMRIVPVFGPGALQVSPRVGHLHVLSTTYPGGGPTPATTTRSTSPDFLPASTR